MKSPRSLSNGALDFFGKKWPRAFFLTGALQAILCIAFEAYTFAKFQGSLVLSANDFNGRDDVQAPLLTIPTFLSLFILGFVYEMILVWDALRQKNTIQVIGICIANLALLVYTAIQIDQIKEAIDTLLGVNFIADLNIWDEVHSLLIAIPIIISVATLVLGFIAWKLYQEFAWDILKHIGADYRMKKRFLAYQIYIALLKFDFFFFVGFTIQFLVVVGGKTGAEFGLTIAAIPITIAILCFAAWFTRHEMRAGVYCTIVLYLGGLAYFIFKLARIYMPSHAKYYQPVRKSLTAFTVLTILLIILTIINAIVCMLNFGNGLKAHLLKKPTREGDKDQNSYTLGDVKQQPLPSRMTID